MAVLCMLYKMIKIRFNPMHPLSGALAWPYVPLRVIVHRYTYSIPHCRTLQYLKIFISLSVSLWNYLADPAFDGVGLAGFKNRANIFLLSKAAKSIFVFFYFALSLLSVYILVLLCWGSWIDSL